MNVLMLLELITRTVRVLFSILFLAEPEGRKVGDSNLPV